MELTWFGWLYVFILVSVCIFRILLIGDVKKEHRYSAGGAVVFIMWSITFAWLALNVGFTR